MKKRVTVLSIDGGGMRGVMPAMVIAEMEQRTGKPVSQLFDLIAGTSTGAIIAACAAMPDKDGKPKYSGARAYKFYEEEGPLVFPQSAWRRITTAGALIDAKYPSEGATDFFERLFGEVRLSDALTELLIPSFELELGTPFFFTRDDARDDAMRNFYIKQAVHASISAPTFFEPYVVKSPDLSRLKHLVFVDGSVVANNPAMCAYAEAKHLFPEAQEYVVVSLGTGDYGARQLYEEKNRWGAVQWLGPAVKILMAGSVDVVDHQLQILHQASGDHLKHYWRFQVPVDAEASPLDDASEPNMHSLELIAENMIKDNSAQLDAVCELLTR